MKPPTLLCVFGTPEALRLGSSLDARGVPANVVTSMQDAVSAVATDPPETIVIVLANASGAPARPLHEWTMEAWMATADDPIFDLLYLLQALHGALGEREAVIVLVGPDLGQTGAAGYVALSAAAEGQRGLMKTLARQWGPAIRFAWAGIWPPLLFPEIRGEALPEQPELGAYTPPLGERPGWDAVAKTVMALAELGGATTGQSVMVDGGEWMLP